MSSEKVTPEAVMVAVRDLRSALNKTQTEFGRMIGKGLATIQRYETLVPPKGEALTQFANLAQNLQRFDLANIFLRTLAAEIGIDLPAQPWFHLRMEAISENDLMDFQALINLKRDFKRDPARYGEEAGQLDKLFKNRKQEIQASRNRFLFGDVTIRSIAKLAQEGKSRAEIEELLGVRIEGGDLKRFPKDIQVTSRHTNKNKEWSKP